MASKIMLHAKLCILTIIFITCVCLHPESMCWALSSFGQIRLVERFKQNTSFLVVQGSCSALHIMMHLILAGTWDVVRIALLAAPLAVLFMIRVWQYSW
jgi:hypothetical protein